MALLCDKNSSKIYLQKYALKPPESDTLVYSAGNIRLAPANEARPKGKMAAQSAAGRKANETATCTGYVDYTNRIVIAIYYSVTKSGVLTLENGLCYTAECQHSPIHDVANQKNRENMAVFVENNNYRDCHKNTRIFMVRYNLQKATTKFPQERAEDTAAIRFWQILRPAPTPRRWTHSLVDVWFATKKTIQVWEE
ncbi:MAG: hypothetical protein FWE19_08340 [Oscillospiraceae bacterium]|nr:hypothetical protein [Oscillospiraceae bacterium]